MDIITLALLASQALAPTVPAVGLAGPVLRSRFDVAPPAVPAPRDSMFEYSAAYYRRLAVHRAGSYAILPLFAFEYLAGKQLYEKSFEAPSWAKTGHRIASTAVAALFTVNTVTGLMNLYEGRKDPRERKHKVFHALMMLSADAGFTVTGILADRAEGSADDRRLHRTVAYASMGVATIGYLSMLDIFRKD